LYNEVAGQFSRYLGHVTKNVGGIMETPKTVDEQGPVYEVVAESKQREAVDFLNKQVFATPAWLINQDIFGRTGLNGVTIISSLQENILSRLFSSRTMSKLLDAEAAQGNNAYQLTELLNDLKKGIWSELAARKPIDIYRRNLQKSYITYLSNIISPPSAGGISLSGIIIVGLSSYDKSDVKSVIRAHLSSLRNEINTATAGITDPMSKYHLQDVAKRIDNALNPKD